ncbi:MAG: hypothetical protein R3B49_00570 [Phycisphaerales bacterium]
MNPDRAVPVVLAAAFLTASPVWAGDDEQPPFEKGDRGVRQGSVDRRQRVAMWTIYERRKDAQLIAELPKDFEGKEIQWIPTVAGGDRETGVYSIYHREVGIPGPTVFWEQRGDRLALIQPDYDDRTTGDAESRRRRPSASTPGGCCCRCPC